MTWSEVPAHVQDFAALFQGGNEVPTQGYGIDKVVEMPESKHLATLTRDGKASAAPAGPEAAGDIRERPRATAFAVQVGARATSGVHEEVL